MSYVRLARALLEGRPYFGMAFRALQGDPRRHRYFLPVVRQVVGRGGATEILEVGTWAGASAISWAKALEELGRAGQVTCVDAWVAYFDLKVDAARHYREMNDAAERGDVFRLFLHNVRASGVAHRVRWLVGDSREVLPRLPAESFDVVYIDGAHVFEIARSDIAEGKRIVRHGGILCGDDLELQRHEVELAEHAGLVERGVDYARSWPTGEYYHPGVTEAVAVELGVVSVRDGFWAVRKGGRSWEAVELDVDTAKLPDHVAAAVEEGQVSVVAETVGFNVIKVAGEGYVAVAKGLGPVEPFVERLGERDLWPLVLAGRTHEEVRAKVASAAGALRALERGLPRLVGERAGFNLVAYGGKFYGLRQSLGDVDVTVGEHTLVRQYGPENVIVGPTLETVVAQIEARQRGRRRWWRWRRWRSTGWGNRSRSGAG